MWLELLQPTFYSHEQTLVLFEQSFRNFPLVLPVHFKCGLWLFLFHLKFRFAQVCHSNLNFKLTQFPILKNSLTLCITKSSDSISIFSILEQIAFATNSKEAMFLPTLLTIEVYTTLHASVSVSTHLNLCNIVSLHGCCYINIIIAIMVPLHESFTLVIWLCWEYVI